MIVYRDNMQDMYVIHVKYMPFISYMGVGVVLLGSIYFGVKNYKQYKHKADLYPLHLPKITHYYTENTFGSILTAYYEGLKDFWDKGYFANNQKIVDLNTTNFADLWFNSTPSSYPVFMVIGSEFNKDSFPKPEKIFADATYIAVGKSVACDVYDVYCNNRAMYVNGLWNVYGGGYIPDNYHIVDENITYTLYKLREKLK